jgi:peroxidase
VLLNIYRDVVGTTTNIESANNLPSPFDPLETLQEKFRNLGLDDTDLVALQGAHTFGRAQCQFMLYSDPNSIK